MIRGHTSKMGQWPRVLFEIFCLFGVLFVLEMVALKNGIWDTLSVSLKLQIAIYWGHLAGYKTKFSLFTVSWLWHGHCFPWLGQLLRVLPKIQQPANYFSSFIINYLYFRYISICLNVSLWRTWTPEEEIGSPRTLGLELQTAMSCCMAAWNWTLGPLVQNSW